MLCKITPLFDKNQRLLIFTNTYLVMVHFSRDIAFCVCYLYALASMLHNGGHLFMYGYLTSTSQNENSLFRPCYGSVS